MWQNIAASETDANSPLNQTLLDKIRGNLDHLRGIGASMKFVNTRYNQSDATADLVLDQDQDWRDRYIQVVGVVFMGNSDDCDEVELGGSKDGRIGSDYTVPPLLLRSAQFDGWMYGSAGVAARASDPHLFAEDVTGDPDMYVWVNSSTGFLMLSSVTERPSGTRNLVCHLRLTWSDDQGAH